jgi:phosphoribosylanthranilate isomerase
MKLKVCGMKYIENIKSIADLSPDYLGFIFYAHSKRYFTDTLPELPKHIKKTGVFVNEELTVVISLQKKHQLQALQLHGDESVAYIQKLKSHISNKVELIKVVSIDDTANFEVLVPFEKEIDYFLFDTKGKERGGNGIQFDWSVLNTYPFSKPFFLSGGIGPNDAESIKEIEKKGLPIFAVDINSKFEDKPGLKNSIKVINFKNQL